MNKELFTSILTVIIFIVGFVYVLKIEPSSLNKDQTFITSVTYHCDNDREITVSYFNGPEKPISPGDTPQPTGSVNVSFDTNPSQTLNQTISASGVRYANSDESLIFWNKGNSALIMRNNTMDLTYSNCLQTQ